MLTMRWLLALLVLGLLSACSGPKYTVDDGRKVNEELLGQIRTYGSGERALRPAIARSATLEDKECDKQWELPFSVASSDDWAEDDRVAWARALGVDERLTVIAAAQDSPLQVGDRIEGLQGFFRNNGEVMMEKLAELRDKSYPFSIKLSTGKVVEVKPFQVCRGYTRLASPGSPKAQDYHWLMSIHPLEVTRQELTEDEALWMVLWTQGVSEEGGVRMKAYSYGTKIVGTVYNIVTIASGVQGAALAANAAMKTAQAAAANVATEVIKQQLIDQASSYATSKMREQVMGIAQKLTQQQVVNAMQVAAANRGSLSGVAWIASTVFDRADAWAYQRMEKLQANPLAGFTLHQKLIEQGLASNAMVFDQERLTALNKIAETKGRGDEVSAILQGMRPEDLQVALADMPSASAPKPFGFDEIDSGTAADPSRVRGLIDDMLQMNFDPASGKK